jgi:hypothetical protein
MTELSKRELDLLRPVKLIVAENPKKVGSQAHERFEAYFACESKYPDGYTIKDAYKEGVRGDDIRHDLAHGFILVGEEAIEEFESSKPREMLPEDIGL